MKVLAFDIGIKNLAYCVSTYDEETNKYNIVEPYCDNWNIINLINDKDIKCQCEDCENNVTQYAKVDGQMLYYCGKHKKLHKELLENNMLDFEFLNTDERCQYTKSCKTKARYKYRDMCYCTTHKNAHAKLLIKERNLQKYKVIVKDFTIHDLKVKLLKTLEEYIDIFLYVDEVYLENQPAYCNPTMKAISDVLYSWFLIRVYADSEYYQSTIKKIGFTAAANKMKINGMGQELNEEIDNAPNKYKKTKELSIVQTKSMLSHNQDYIDHLDSFGVKLDDMCDSYLHGVYQLQKNLKKIK